jgi:hypothetical protein
MTLGCNDRGIFLCMKRFCIVAICIASFILLLAGCSASVFSLGPGSQQFDTVLISKDNIPDNNFRNFLVDTLGLITLGDCSRLTILTVEYKDVVDISGIKHFTSLIELHMANKQDFDNTDKYESA